uniref:Ig-like domain-containing protein n=1 Tax=Zosterops lateralis melanops TaxID=1220523 RepID=A0A8D2PLP2_ZOSLA
TPHAPISLSPWCHPHPVLVLSPFQPRPSASLLLVEPPWRPAVEWDRVTLTCQGSGTAGATTWFKDGQQWGQKGPNRFTVTESGTYQASQCTGDPVCGIDWLVMQVPARPLVEGDMVTLCCRGWRNRSVTQVRFYREDEEVSRSLPGTELSLTPLQLHHSGDYHCRGWVYSEVSRSWEWQESAPVTVHGEPHPHSLPGSPAWGHSAPSGHLQPCLWIPITAQTPHPCLRGHQPAGTGRAPCVPGTQP